MTARLTLERPWLSVRTEAPVRVLSWALNRPGFTTTREIVWREVRNADLPADLDVSAWLDAELAARGTPDAVAFLTSRDVRAYKDITLSIEDVSLRCVATVGLSNAEAVGSRMDRSAHDWGTINILVLTGFGLTDAARIEALSLVAEARTQAVMSAGLDLSTGRATGTGTDCIAVAAPDGPTGYAGKHTALGEAVGKAVCAAVTAGAQEWMATVRRKETL